MARIGSGRVRWIALLIACLVLARIVGVGSWVRSWVEWVARKPFASVAGTLDHAMSWRPKQWCGDLARADMGVALERLSALEGSLRALQEENATLRALAKVGAESKMSWIGAQVISRDLRGDRARLLLDRGSLDGARMHQAVLSGTGVVIGKIADVTAHTSVVELVTDPQSRFSVTIEASSTKKLVGVLEGRGKGSAWLMYIPPQTYLTQNQLVWTAGTEDEIPQYLPLGVINDVRGNPSDPFLSASVEPLIHPEDIMVVSIMMAKR